jgi:hypothetical protein
LALFTAWHIAVFHSHAKAGKLKSWAEIRRQFSGTTEKPIQVDWRTRKAQREQQMASFHKHQAQRQKPPVKRGR